MGAYNGNTTYSNTGDTQSSNNHMEEVALHIRQYQLLTP